MSKLKPEVKKFLDKTEAVLEPKSVTDEFLEIVKRENIRQIKKQLAADLAPLVERLNRIEHQQDRIINLLERKLELDKYEKDIMDLLKAQLEKP